MQAYTIIGLTMGGDAPFIHKDKVYTDLYSTIHEIYELLYEESEECYAQAIKDEHFWIADTFYKIFTVEIELPKGFYKEVQNFNPSDAGGME